jgi:hypothetical protein
MLALFCLRLAGGMLAALPALRPTEVNPRFYRVQFLTALGLSAVAAYFLRDIANGVLWVMLGLDLVLAFAGSLVWSLERAPLGRITIAGSVLASYAALLQAAQLIYPESSLSVVVVDQLTSALVLGSVTSAMLMGHSYLIAPSMSLRPLLLLIGGVFASLALRSACSAWGLWDWTREHPLVSVNETTFLLPMRWLIGLVGPSALAVLAWQTARIRSTQSATGILYVVVILAFLGEVVSLVLFQMTGFTL